MAAKTDMERVGLFKEQTYHTVGDPYKSPGKVVFNQAATKGRQMFPGGSKEKSALVHGYFGDFQRIFEKEAATDPIKMRRQYRVKELAKNIGKIWTPSSYSKKPAGLGNSFGTFSGKCDAFSPVQKPKQDYKAPGKNMMTSPPKQGTGYGYNDVTIAKFPEYKPSKYDVINDLVKKENDFHKKSVAGRSGAFRSSCYMQSLFDSNIHKPSPGQKSGTKSAPATRKDIKPFRPSNPTKRDGGCRAGTFDPFPKYASSPYNIKVYKRTVHVVNNTGKTFIPNTGLKGTPNDSIIDKNVYTQVNQLNYSSVQSVMGY